MTKENLKTILILMCQEKKKLQVIINLLQCLGKYTGFGLFSHWFS